MEKAIISQEERNNFYSELDSFMRLRKWNKFQFNGKEFYSKSEDLIKENMKENAFLRKPSKRKKISFDNFFQNFKNFFKEEGYSLDSKKEICLNKKGDTFLRSAAVQYFQNVFFEEGLPSRDKFFIFQPVIRTQYIDSIKEGCVSSFVNIATEQINPTLKDHFNHLDNWIEVLSKSGLYMGDILFSIVPKERYAKGKTGLWSKTDGLNIGINYLGLNIGDAGLIKFPQSKTDLWISDTGFGLERLAWAYYKNNSFFELIGPSKEVKNKRTDLVDGLRSLTLLSMSNVSNASQDAKNQFRKYLKNVAKYDGLFDTFNLISNYHDYWSKFIFPIKSKLDTYFYLNDQLENLKQK